MALGLTARLLWLSAHSVLLDEATVVIGARDIVQNHTPMWDAMSNAPFVWMIGRLLGMGGLSNVFLMRLPSALIGVASIAAVFWLARRLFNEKIAIASAFLLALHPFAVAFSRVLFADPFQVFFVLIGCYGFDRLASNTWRATPRKGMLLLYVFCVWGLAFLMKYNAVVPGAIWLLSGVISRRYRILPACAAFLAMAFGSFFTLLLWPYDAPIWLLAFMGKAGSYSLIGAVNYYSFKLHLVFFGITEIVFVAGFLVAWLLRRKSDIAPDRKETNIRSSKSIFHLTLFILLQTVMLILLGRMFERYLLVLVPFGCILLVALIAGFEQFSRWNPNRWMFAFMEAKENKLPPTKGRHILFYFAVYISLWIFTRGAYNSYSYYFDYLRNDVDYAGLAKNVLTLEQEHQAVGAFPRRAFWLVPEPIAAYYLGYTQRYSRAVVSNFDGPTAYQNFFEFVGVPYAEEWKGDKVLAIRRLARAWGVGRILTSPNSFMMSAKRAVDSGQLLLHLPVVDFTASDFIRPGDMLIMQSGMIDLEGEPILEDIEHEDGPPFIPTLPLARYNVYRTYRPEGVGSQTDTSLERVKAGAWLLIRK
jgi:hypothetical protein